MKTKNLIISLAIALIFPLTAFAIGVPLFDEPPTSVDADSYTFTFYTEEGAKISVLGGPAFIAPVTDGFDPDGEANGTVEVTVGLAQNQENTFSITAEINEQTSDSVMVTINEVSSSAGEGDTTPPDAPFINEIPEFVDAIEYIITGETEPYANVTAVLTDGTIVGSLQADSRGIFQFLVDFEEDKTNRVNITAEDEAGNVSPATQAVIRQSVDLPEEEEAEEEEELFTSAQVFFEDIQGHWAQNYIEALYEEDVVSGKTETIFEPNGYITRAELTKIAILAFGYSINTSVDEHPFSDVPRNSWFAPYVEEAKRLEIIEGYPSGGFGPNDYITRAAALKIIIEASEIDFSGYTPDFPDVDTSSWYAPYVGYAQANGIISGYPDGTFGPGNYITRAAVAKIVVNMME
ncbi:S-layer homology domain-containing protein [Patescibacteria group bacterium]|nr:S-layer homology domain-containing protein [Patescibacteria group bacterium]